MSISKVKITNFKCFQEFEMELNHSLNILVGNNEAGKSTVLEAIHLALTGLYCGRSIGVELSQYLFNTKAVDAYLASVNAGVPISPPSIVIEVYFDGSIDPNFEGDGNSERARKVEGIIFQIAYNEKYNAEYSNLITQKDLHSLPIEYYEVSWYSFSRQPITPKSIPIKSAMIDSSNYRYQNGSDVYISRIVKDLLSPEEITSVSQAHRKMREAFIGNDSIKAINARIQQEATIVDGDISLSVDLGTRNAWENSLVTKLNDIPFGFIGKGAQCTLKTELALTQKRAQNAHIILLEEPESHLSYSKLNQLISSIQDKYQDKQIIVSTHSSFVANKLGLENIWLIREQTPAKLADFKSADFFKKVAGYDTLRLILCKRAILVEGDSDELVVQKAYMSLHDGKLPIQDGIDVISVGTSFLRFLEIADVLNVDVSVVTDNDGDIDALRKKYNNFLGENSKPNIRICYDQDVDEGTLCIGKNPYNYNTLEPKLFKANEYNLALFNELFGTEYTEADDLRKYMKHNKTECALAVFNTDREIAFPEYILEAVKDVQ